jgi:NADPH-dependent curcumin reductase CurA
VESVSRRRSGSLPKMHMSSLPAGVARQIVLAARPNGKPKPTDFRLEETAVPTPSSGQILLGVQYLSLDPYMRGRMDDRKSYAKALQIGEVMIGEAVARVIASKHPDYSTGDIVLAQTEWRTHALSNDLFIISHRTRPLRRGMLLACASLIPPRRQLRAP